MVIKVDHVSYSCTTDEEYRHILTDGYRLSFKEKNLINAPCKKDLLLHGAVAHDIIFYNSLHGDIPLEITIYPHTQKADDEYMAISSKEVIFYVRDLYRSIQFFRCFGMVIDSQSDDEALLQIISALDKSCFYLKLIKTKQDTSKRYLDCTGYSSLALFVDNTVKISQKVAKTGFKVTEVSSIEVNRRKLLVSFAIGSNGEIVELISLDRGGR